MQVHQLRYFVAAAEENGISRAAEKLRISQPALSRQIALLEQELGADLFKRERQRVSLTPAGRFFLPRARQILCDLEAAAQQVGEQFGGDRRTLRLGFIGAFLDDLVAPATRDFARTHPRTQVSLFDLPPQGQIERLRNGELDAAILANLEERDRRRFRCRHLLRNRMAAVMPSAHPLARRKSLRLAELSAERWLSLSDAFFPGRRAFFESCCQAAGFKPRSVRDTDSLPLMFAAIANGEGMGIAPIHSAKFPHAGCVFVPISTPDISTQLLLLLPKSAENTPLEALANSLTRQAAVIAQE
jgi:DNA-binding transcriptional LysR family regulator